MAKREIRSSRKIGRPTHQSVACKRCEQQATDLEGRNNLRPLREPINPLRIIREE